MDEKIKKELEEKYKSLFNKIVKTIKEEENVTIVYNVLLDILTQMDEQLRSKHECPECSDECNECGHDGE